VGVGVGDLEAWTPAVPSLVFASLRLSLTLLAHCSWDDPQLPSLCLRLRRLSHYLVWVSDAEHGQADHGDGATTEGSGHASGAGEGELWVVTLVLHIRAKLVKLRASAYHHSRVNDDD